MPSDRNKILVTGGAGFIGSHVAEDLLKKGYSVTILDDLSGGFRENIPSCCEFVEGSVDDEKLVYNLFETNKYKIVYHLAAYAAEGLSHFIRRYNYTNNLIGSVTLLNAAIKYGTRRFVFTSSIAVYGTNQLPMREDMIPTPEDPYGIAKRAFELDLAAASKMFDIEYVVFRPHNVYGERQNVADPYRNVVGIFLNKILKKQSMPIFGDGSQTRAFSYIADVAPNIVRGGFEEKAKNRIFNIGADEPISVNELAHICAEAMGVSPRINYLPHRSEVMHAFSDHSALKEIFGEYQATSIRNGIKKMANWILHQDIKKSVPFTNIEIEKGLPETWTKIH